MSANKINDDDTDDVVAQKTINRTVAADVKPWFFIYRYSELKAETDKYMKASNKSCKIRFGKSIDDLYAAGPNLSDDEKQFLQNHETYMPVSRAPGTMNRICWRIENEFKTLNVVPNAEFDRSILKSDAAYTQEQYDDLCALYGAYNKNMQAFLKGVKHNDLVKDERFESVEAINAAFMDQCSCVCPDMAALTNALVDICYTSAKSKAFVWDLVGEQIFKNLLEQNHMIAFPTRDPNGDIEYCGKRYSLQTKEYGVDEHDYTE